MQRRTLRATVLVGHKNTHFIEVPWHPETEWPGHASVPMDRIHDPRGGRGWPVTASAGEVTFDAFIGHRYGHSYLVLNELARADLGDSAGDEVDLVVAPRDPR